MTILDTSTIDPTTYVPVLVDAANGLFTMPLLACPVCNRPMLNLAGVMMSGDSTLRTDIQLQLQRADWRLPSNITDDQGRPLCSVDAQNVQPSTTFSCFSCGLTQPVNSIQSSFGTLNPSFLCQACYSRLPAKQWNDMVTLLTDRHLQDPPAPVCVNVFALVSRTAQVVSPVTGLASTQHSTTVSVSGLAAQVVSLSPVAVSTVITATPGGLQPNHTRSIPLPFLRLSRQEK